MKMCSINCSGGCPECAPDEHLDVLGDYVHGYTIAQKVSLAEELLKMTGYVVIHSRELEP